MTQKNEAQINFCVQYLRQHGVDAEHYKSIVIPENGPSYKLIRDDDLFFNELASKMRELWPQGEKEVREGSSVKKYPWRGSVPELAKRLKFIWGEMQLDDYTIEECLTAARKYLAQFENSSVKYMRTLPYFIFRQEKNLKKSGFYSNSYKSPLADFLTGANAPDEFLQAFGTSTFGDGNLL